MSAPSPWPANWAPADGDAPGAIGGISVAALAQEYGTSTFVLDLADLRARMDAWAAAAKEHFADERGLAGADIYYASKAFTCVSLIRLAVERGLCADVASGGELAVALAGGMDPARIGVHGNNKSDEEIAAALDAGVGRIVVDSLGELDLVSAAAAERGVIAPVFIRVTTGVHAGANEYIATAHEDQKFGLSLTDGSALAAARRAVELPNVSLDGLHQHIGSQISDLEGHAVSTRALLSLRAEISRATGRLVPEIDLGGGYGITYVEEPTLTADEVCAQMSGVVRAACEVLETAPPRISFEPGRNIVGPTMITLYTVGSIKRVTIGNDSLVERSEPSERGRNDADAASVEPSERDRNDADAASVERRPQAEVETTARDGVDSAQPAAARDGFDSAQPAAARDGVDSAQPAVVRDGFDSAAPRSLRLADACSAQATSERWYVAVDGGMGDTVLRPMLYDAIYTAEVASRRIPGEQVRARLVGKHCESGDILIRDLELPADLRRGDLIAVPATGAYGRSMSSNYNMLARSPVIAVENGSATPWIHRETIADMMRSDAAL